MKSVYWSSSPPDPIFLKHYPNQLPWLTASDSMTQRIEQYTKGSVQITLLKQTWALPDESECSALPFISEKTSWIREVYLSTKKQTWMYARTIFPKQTLQGDLNYLQSIQEEPLGHYLFTDPRLKRSPFHFAMLTPQTIEYERASTLFPHVPNPLAARRSCFLIEEKPILITEIFL